MGGLVIVSSSHLESSWLPAKCIKPNLEYIISPMMTYFQWGTTYMSVIAAHSRFSSWDVHVGVDSVMDMSV